MTYLAGLNFPGQVREPALHCDEAGCGTVLVVRLVRGFMPAWLRNRKAPPGWRMTIQDDRRRDSCPLHRAAQKNREAQT